MGSIIVVGSSNTDMVVRSQKIPAPGETVLGSEFDIVQGGKGANQAVAAARAGSTVSFIARVGNDGFGHAAISGYRKDHINTEYIIRDPAYPTGVAIIIVDENTGQNSILVAPGSNSRLSVKDIDRADEEIAHSQAILMQLEVPLEVIRYTLALAQKKGVKTILNPAPAQALSDEILRSVDIITPNETETEILTGIKLTNKATIIQAADFLLKNVNEAVIITLGSNGVYYKLKSGEDAFVIAPKADAVDTTAAGDVFNGYFASALTDGVDFNSAIQLANNAAALSVTRRGAQPSIPAINEMRKS
jgi:ribokinase